MKRPRARFMVELDTSMSRDVDYWTTVLIDVIHGDNRTNGDHPFIAFDSVTAEQPEIGDVFETAVQIDDLPRGSAVEAGGRLYFRLDIADEHLSWAYVGAQGREWANSHEIPLPAIVRFVP